MSGRGYQPKGGGPCGEPPRGGSSGKSTLTETVARVLGSYATTVAAPTLTLTFRDSGLFGAEIATLGDYVVGAVEKWGVGALWSFYPETARRLVRHPADTAEQCRRIIHERTIDMLHAMGLRDVALVVVIAIERKDAGR